MHEFSLIANLLHKIDDVIHEQGARRAVTVHVKLGALAHISADHFRGHFVDGSRGTVAEGACLKIEESDDPDDPHAQDILLQSVEVAD